MKFKIIGISFILQLAHLSRESYHTTQMTLIVAAKLNSEFFMLNSRSCPIPLGLTFYHKDGNCYTGLQLTPHPDYGYDQGEIYQATQKLNMILRNFVAAAVSSMSKLQNDPWPAVEDKKRHCPGLKIFQWKQQIWPQGTIAVEEVATLEIVTGVYIIYELSFTSV